MILARGGVLRISRRLDFRGFLGPTRPEADFMERINRQIDN